MAEKPPAFTVTDRRKFTVDGDLREGAATAEPPPQTDPAAAPAQFNANVADAVHPAPGQFGARVADAVHPAPGQASAPVGEAVHPAPGFGARVVTMPSPAAPPPPPPGPAASVPAQAAVAAPEDVQEDAGEEGDQMPEPTAAESAEQHAAYQESSQQLDDMIRQANPGAKAAGPVTIEHVFQSIYLSAVVAMGAAAEPGQKPRIDIIGARQSIDMLTVLQEKTRGNLSEKEQRLMQNMLFEVRMMFLEITNAIAHQAQNPPPGKK
jgi:Domain of unknown function (DUF1844)